MSVDVFPVPQVAPPWVYVSPDGVCGSLRRSKPITVGLLANIWASVTQSFTQFWLVYGLAYHKPSCSADSPASDLWLSRMTLSPAAPAAVTIFCSICSAFRPTRSDLMVPPVLLCTEKFCGIIGVSTIWLENGMRIVL